MAEASRQNDKSLIIQTEEVTKVVGRNLGEKGDPGVGIPGESPQGWNPAGEWDSASAYSELDVVVHKTEDGGDGSAYICLQTNTNRPPSTNSNYWALIVQAVEGPQGPGGDNTTTAVQVGVWRGAWALGTSYQKNHLVRYQGSVYVAESGHTATNGNRPDVAGDRWTLFVQRGSVGPAGPAGPQGQQGLQGNQGVKGDDPPASLSLGPWVETRILGFVNNTGSQIVLGNEIKSGTGTIIWRKKNNSVVSVPVTLQQGDLYEVRVENVIDRCYLSYRVERS